MVWEIKVWLHSYKYNSQAKTTPINIATERYKSVHKYEIACMLGFLQNRDLISERHVLVKYQGGSCTCTFQDWALP